MTMATENTAPRLRPMVKAVLDLLDARSETAVSPSVDVAFADDRLTLSWEFPNGNRVSETASLPLFDHTVMLRDLRAANLR